MERPENEGTYPDKFNVYCYDINHNTNCYREDLYKANYNDEYEPRYTLILKVTLEDNIFICNRNSKDYDNIFNDKYVKWWESNFVDIMKFSNIDNCETLEILDYDNHNLRHQKLINPIKEKYIQKYNAKYVDDKTLSNVLFNNIKDNYRTKYKIQYKDFKLIVDKLSNNIYQLLYENAKKLYFNKSERYFLNLSRERIWHSPNRLLETKVCYIILRDYLLNRINNNYKMPFDKNERKIKDTIDMLLKLTDINEKPKIRNLIKKELNL